LATISAKQRNNEREVAEFTLLLCSNHTKSDALTLLLWAFPPSLLCLLLRIEWLGQRVNTPPTYWKSGHRSMVLRMNRSL
jgi:hypothetical protein